FARTTGQQRKPWHPRFVQARDHDMRDFRDAKAMAHTLRAALAARGVKITLSESLELTAKLFGVADWNTLAAAIRRELRAPRGKAPSPPLAGEAASGHGRGRRRQPRDSMPFSKALDHTLFRAIGYAGARDHEYATLEHLLLALIDDVDAMTVMQACKVDLDALEKDVALYVDNEMKTLVAEFDGESTPTPAFQRVVDRAMRAAEGAGRDVVTGADLLVAMFDEEESPAVWFLGEHALP